MWPIYVIYAVFIGLAALIPIVLMFFVAYQVKQYLRSFNYRFSNYRRARRGRGMDVAELARRLRITERELQQFVPHYHERQIPKRSGGVRVLQVPDRPTRDIQRRILRLLLGKLRVHPAVHGFERGRSIVTNALPHVGQIILIKLDIKDFFGSTSAERIEWYFRIIGWDKEAAALLTRLCTHNGSLPQGAATSPRLSNLVNYKLDRIMEKVANRSRCAYTRYADDLTFSSTWKRTKHPGTLARGVVQNVSRRLKPFGYELNAGKVRILRRHQQQRVTGLVVNDMIDLPRRKRRWLRAVRHRIATGQEATLSPEQLRGWDALQRMITTQRDGPAE